MKCELFILPHSFILIMIVWIKKMSYQDNRWRQ